MLLAGTVPVLGVCLGMQGLVTAYGGSVVQDLHLPAHGEIARINHDGRGVFAGLPQDFAAVRYHSLTVLDLPDCLVATASCPGDRDEVPRSDGRAPPSLPLEGVQFHPESILSEHGAAMIANFLGRAMTDPVPFFREVVAAHPRCFWLDGGGAREWSGRRSIIGWLDDDDVSLTYDAARGEVVRHASGRLGRGRRRRVRRPGGRARRRAPDRPVVRLLRLRLPARPPRRDRERDARRRVDAGPARADVRAPAWRALGG